LISTFLLICLMCKRPYKYLVIFEKFDMEERDKDKGLHRYDKIFV